MLECEKVRSLFSEYLDDELDPEIQNGVTAHISACTACTKAMREYEESVSKVKTHLEKLRLGRLDLEQIRQSVLKSVQGPT